MGRKYFGNSIIRLALVVLFLFQIILYVADTRQYEEGKLASICFIALLVLLLFIFKKDHIGILRGQYFRLSNIFLAGFIIVHYQFYIDMILGNYGLDRIDLIVDQNVILKSALISTIALTAFCIGYTSQLKQNFSQKSEKGYKDKIFNLSNMKILILLFFILFVFSTPFSYFRGGSITVSRGVLSLYAETFLTLAVICYLMLTARNLKLKNINVKNPWAFIRYNGLDMSLVIFCFIFLIMMSGDRGPLISIVTVYVGCYFIVTHRKIHLSLVIFGFVVLSTAISFFAYIRHASDSNSFAEVLEQSIAMKQELAEYQKSFSTSTFELSKSVRTLHAAVSYTNNFGYSYGTFQGFSLISIIPGAGTIIIPLFGLEKGELKSTHVLTTYLGKDHGMGTTVVADIWLDFGIIGIIIVFFIFGIFLRKLDFFMYSNSTLTILTYVVIAVFLARGFAIGRNSLLLTLRDVSFAYLVTIISLFVLSGKKNKIGKK